MLKTSSSSPQLYDNKNAPLMPLIATVSQVDKAACERALNGSGNSQSNDVLSSSCSSSSAGSIRNKGNLSRELLKETIRAKRNEIKNDQDKLNSSLNTPLCKSEEKLIMSNKRWMAEVKDLNNSFDKIPPITANKKVCDKGQSYYVDLN